MEATLSSEPIAEREVVISRTINGPRRLVFAAYTEERHLAAWWGPNGFTTTTRVFQFRPGGVWEFVMHGPDGTDFPNHIEFHEIVAPERLAFTHGQHAGDPEAFASSVTLVERGNQTEVTLRAVFKTKRRKDEVIERFGAIEGGKQTLARLDEYVASGATKQG